MTKVLLQLTLPFIVCLFVCFFFFFFFFFVFFLCVFFCCFFFFAAAAAAANLTELSVEFNKCVV